ncbi:hypothetical protein ACFL5B_00780 [Candidatus Latescibacterota bacterium]
MKDINTKSVHTFHIPVMGTGFSIDTPLQVAKYGISSVISLVDDVLIEQMRKFHCEKQNETYEEIADNEDDARARRITAYLDLVDRLVKKQVKELRASPFEKGSDITRYYEMLPETPLKRSYRDMLSSTDPVEKAQMQEELRMQAVPGSIDVNVMTKLDFAMYRGGDKLPPEFSFSSAALRGFARSTLHSSIVCSAGMNLPFYSYIGNFEDFYPDENGNLRKKIILKVSDYRSAIVQGKFLAKKGLWVSEHRIESGLNCGGHAFASKGYLLGPIMEEFKRKKQEIIETLHTIYNGALANNGRQKIKTPHDVRITVQGGVGTAEENEFLLKYYNIDGTGWGTPFLLVPEVINVDEEHLKRLSAATDSDVYLSDSSPLDIPFWNLLTAAAEEIRLRRIREGIPGSPCSKGLLKCNTEFTKIPACTASRFYQKRKLEHLPKENLSEKQLPFIKNKVLDKSCICHDLGGGAKVKNGIDPHATSCICCGPNIVNFSKIATLEEMLDHIYGRLSLMTNKDRVHMFTKEAMIYVDYLRKEVEKYSLGLSVHKEIYLREFKENLLSGIMYYSRLAEQFFEEKKAHFLEDLENLRKEIECIALIQTVDIGVDS